MAEREQLILKDTKLVKLCHYPATDGATQVLSVRALLTRTLMGGTHQRGTRGRRNPRDRKREAIADGTAPLEELDARAAEANGFTKVPVEEGDEA